jgi:hypothetical protein
MTAGEASGWTSGAGSVGQILLVFLVGLSMI